MDLDLSLLAEYVVKGKKKQAVELTNEAINQNILVSDIIAELTKGMVIISARSKNSILHVPEALIAARAMNGSMAALEPVIAKTDMNYIGTIVIGTVKGDLHDIGKNLVSLMLKGNGFNVIDLGMDVDTAKYLEAAKENNADIIALSALLTSTMPSMRKIIDTLKSSDGFNFKVMIGGAPITAAFADEVGADGYATDAIAAVDLAKSLIV
jgi:5-methyltetrahydrofolate--homocysteine methyltransferase